MKKLQDPRHLKRISTVQKIFSYSFDKENTVLDQEVNELILKFNVIDPLICKAAPQYPIEKIAKNHSATGQRNHC